MREIKLTQGKVAIVDDEDYEWLNQWKWYADKYKDTFYVKRRCYLSGGSGKSLYMHRVIMNPTGKQKVDHKLGNGLDNRKKNLRICTHRQNICNTRKKDNSSSKYLGVFLDKKRNEWLAAIGVNYKVLYLGRYKKESDAAKAYNEAAKKYHGEFARLNVC